MAGNSRSHNWAPKLVFRLLNMALNNAYVVYKELVAREGGKGLSMGRVVKELAMDCANEEQACDLIPRCIRPAHLRDMDRVDGHEKGNKIRKDRKSEEVVSPAKNTAAISAKAQLTAAQKRQWWCKHLPLPDVVRGKCCWVKCPGIKQCQGKRKRSYDTHYRCEQCSTDKESNVYLCHSVKNGEVVSCRIAYHKRYHNKVFPSDER
jgi:hypothetical protein